MWGRTMLNVTKPEITPPFERWNNTISKWRGNQTDQNNEDKFGQICKKRKLS